MRHCRLLWVIEYFLFPVPIIIDVLIVHILFFLRRELIEKHWIINERVLNRVLDHCFLFLIFLLLVQFLVRCVHRLKHVSDLSFKHLLPRILTAFIVDLFDLVLSLLKFLIVTVFVPSALDWTLDAATQSQSIHHILSEMRTVRLLELLSDALLEVFNFIVIIFHHNIICSQVELLLVA